MGNPEHKDYHSRWESMWGSEESVQPGKFFDIGKPAESLKTYLMSQEGEKRTRDKRAVVPGCGRGYDVVLFSRTGAAVSHGIEISPTAVNTASAYVREHVSDNVDASVFEGDFLSDGPRDGIAYDIGYDYTFFCAIHPNMRETWAQGWARHLVSGGTLVTLVFPVEEEGREGPPWPVSLDAYRDVLEPQGFTLLQSDMLAEEQASHPSRAGREIFAVWEKSS